MKTNTTKLQFDAEQQVIRFKAKGDKPIINMVFFGTWDWAFRKMLQQYINLSEQYYIVPSITPIINCDIFQYWRSTTPTAYNFFKRININSPFYINGIQMLHDSPYDRVRSGPDQRKATIDRFSKIMCTSQEQVDFYFKYVKDKTKIIYNPLAPLTRFKKSTGYSKVRIGFVARLYLDKVKGEQTLLEIARQLDPNKFEFIIISPNATALITMLKRLKYNVYTTIEDGFDVLLICSKFEGTPLPLIEALSSKIPVLSTPVGEATTLLHDKNICKTKNEFISRLNEYFKDETFITSSKDYKRIWKDHVFKTHEIWNDIKTNQRIAILSWKKVKPRYINQALNNIPCSKYIFYIDESKHSSSKYSSNVYNSNHILSEANIISALDALNITHVFVWNGDFCDEVRGYQTALINEIKRSKKYTIVFCEHGWLPQTDHISFDNKGVCGNSSITALKKHDMISPTSSSFEYNQLLKKRAELDIKNNGHIYVPLQLNNDVQITKYSPFFKDMAEFIHHVARVFPQKAMYIKGHPKDSQENLRRYKHICETYPNLYWCDAKTTSGLVLAQTCERMISINSTSINEALLCNKPVMTYGHGIFLNKEIVYEIDDISDIRSQQLFLEFKANPHNIDRYLCLLLSKQHHVSEVNIDALQEYL